MILAGCVAKVFPLMFSMSRQVTMTGLASRVVLTCLPVHCLSRKGFCSFYRAAVRSVTLCSVHSTTTALSLRGFHGKSTAQYIASVPRSWSSSPVTITMHYLRRRSTSAALDKSSSTPDVFPKRVTRRTKKKDTDHQSQVNIMNISASVSSDLKALYKSVIIIIITIIIIIIVNTVTVSCLT